MRMLFSVSALAALIAIAPGIACATPDRYLFASDAVVGPNIYKIGPDGTKIKPDGTPGAWSNADGSLAPQGIAVDSSGNVYVASSANNTIYEISAAGVYIGVYATIPTNPGPAGTVSYSVRGMIFDSQGNLYVADNSIQSGDPAHNPYNYIYKVAPGSAGGSATVTQFAGAGIGIGVAQLAVDKDDNVYATSRYGLPGDGGATDYPRGSGMISKTTQAGVTTTFATTLADAYGSPTTVTNRSAHGIAIDRNGNLFVTDVKNGVINEYSNTDGSPDAAKLTNIATLGGAAKLGQIAIDTVGNLYVGACATNVGGLFSSTCSLGVILSYVKRTDGSGEYDAGPNFSTAVNTTRAGVNDIAFGALVESTSVPEPAGWALMLVGIVGLGGILRTPRRKSDAAA